MTVVAAAIVWTLALVAAGAIVLLGLVYSGLRIVGAIREELYRHERRNAAVAAYRGAKKAGFQSSPGAHEGH